MDQDNNPYCAPSINVPAFTDSGAPPVLVSKALRYDNETIIKILIVLFILGVVAAIAGVVLNAMQISLLSNSPINPAEADWNDVRQGIRGIAALTILVVTSIFFGMFVIRAHHNVRGFGAEGMTITPGWAFGYFFVPILGLFKPYLAMSELWRASQSPSQWLNLSKGLVPLWWTIWIISSILGQISFRLSMAADTVPLIIGSTWVALVDDVLDVPLCFVAMFMLMRIQRSQAEWAKSPTTDEESL